MTAGTICRTTAAKSAKSRIVAVGAIAVAGTLLLTGCGDQTDKKEDGGKKVVSAPLSDELPANIRNKGVIKVGSDIAYPPVEFKDKDGKTVGIDPDIADAMGKQLGVTFEFDNGTFDTLLGGLRSKRYDIAMSAMTDTKNRQEGIDEETGKKVGTGVDFVDYFTAGVSIYTKKGDDQGIKTWQDLCGKKIVVQRGTVSHDMAKAESKKCKSGKISIESFDNDQQAQTRLRSGGADAGSAMGPRGRRFHRAPVRGKAPADFGRAQRGGAGDLIAHDQADLADEHVQHHRQGHHAELFEPVVDTPQRTQADAFPADGQDQHHREDGPANRYLGDLHFAAAFPPARFTTARLMTRVNQLSRAYSLRYRSDDTGPSVSRASGWGTRGS